MGKNASPTWESLVSFQLHLHQIGNLRFAKTFLPAAPSFCLAFRPRRGTLYSIEHEANVLGFVIGTGLEPALDFPCLFLFTLVFVSLS